MCGFLGIVDPDQDVIGLLYSGLQALQHRGQDSAGFSTYDKMFHIKKGNGLVKDMIEPRHLERLKGRMGIAHVRYPTIGGGTEHDAQPFETFHPHGIAMAHNGNVVNFHALKAELITSGRHINSGCDVEVILAVFGEALAKRNSLDAEAVFSAVAEVFARVKGAYSVVAVIARFGMVVFRDPSGIRPCSLGRRQGAHGTAWAAASESVAFGLMDYEWVGDLGAGEAMIIPQGGGTPLRRAIAPGASTQPCIFEYVYFARTDSVIDGLGVHSLRKELGLTLAAKIRGTGTPFDVVIPVPDSARVAAQSLAAELGIPYSEGLVKNRYVGRTFIMPSQSLRRSSIRSKLTPVESEIRGRHVLLVDDSIVRGNTSARIVEMVRAAGALSVGLASYSPPVLHPCYYGIDMSRHEELVAYGRTMEQVRRIIGCDRLIYQDLPEMLGAASRLAPTLKGFCNACFSGNYLIGGIEDKDMESLAADRDKGDLPLWQTIPG